ncbi:9902_t:CDS:2 [Ambispora leptoticha]|uniref:9902_t:CDS:1 n=1 Tax=Ambispora leptoticha TaxID=144679 RepID=A0A9N9FMC2_9GLOM|nr:9902_t:CDS:2 [Ambispora leptoticha]
MDSTSSNTLENPTETANVFKLEALSLNYNGNISKFNPCYICKRDILTFRLCLGVERNPHLFPATCLKLFCWTKEADEPDHYARFLIANSITMQEAPLQLRIPLVSKIIKDNEGNKTGMMQYNLENKANNDISMQRIILFNLFVKTIIEVIISKDF